MHVIIVSCPGIGHVGPSLLLAETLLETQKISVVSILAIVTADQASRVPKTRFPESIHLSISVDQYVRPPFDTTYWDEAPETCSKFIKFVSQDNNTLLPPPKAVIYDMFTGWSLLIAQHFKCRFLLMMPSPMRFCYVWAFWDKLGPLFENGDPYEEIPVIGNETMVRSDVLATYAKYFERSYQFACNDWRLNQGIIANDLDEFNSPELLEAVRNYGLNAPCEIYNIGPFRLTDPDYSASAHIEDSDDSIVIKWLNQHPKSSVIYVAFGSWCDLAVQDCCELAHALKSLNKPVLWAYRGVNKNIEKIRISSRPLLEPAEPDGLPLNFRSTIDPSQFLIIPWVDQKAVLAHPSLGIFLSHCGWNSLFEAMALGGKPIAALPIGAEQGMNAHEVEKKWKIGRRLWWCDANRQLERTKLAADILEIYTNEEYKKNAMELQTIIRQSKSRDQHLQRLLKLFD